MRSKNTNLKLELEPHRKQQRIPGCFPKGCRCYANGSQLFPKWPPRLHGFSNISQLFRKSQLSPRPQMLPKGSRLLPKGSQLLPNESQLLPKRSQLFPKRFSLLYLMVLSCLLNGLHGFSNGLQVSAVTLASDVTQRLPAVTQRFPVVTQKVSVVTQQVPAVTRKGSLLLLKRSQLFPKSSSLLHLMRFSCYPKGLRLLYPPFFQMILLKVSAVTRISDASHRVLAVTQRGLPWVLPPRCLRSYPKSPSCRLLRPQLLGKVLDVAQRARVPGGSQPCYPKHPSFLRNSSCYPKGLINRYYYQRVSDVTQKASAATCQVGLSCCQGLRCYPQDPSLPKGSQLCYR